MIQGISNLLQGVIKSPFFAAYAFQQDEEAALLAELERIKKERAEEARKKVRGLCRRFFWSLDLEWRSKFHSVLDAKKVTGRLNEPLPWLPGLSACFFSTLRGMVFADSLPFHGERSRSGMVFSNSG